MRFRKGTSVEVLNYNGEPLGSWMCGELVNGNGQYYTIKCVPNDCKTSEAILSRVARHSIRPSPPLIYVRMWTPGDIVEVRCDTSWKLAFVLRAIDKDNYLVKFMGYSQELKAYKCDIRPRLVWQDEKWVLIGNGHQIMRSNLKGGDGGDNTFHAQYANHALHSCILPSKTLKRASPYISPLVGNSLKRLKIKTDGKHMQAIQTQLTENVHSRSYLPQLWGDKCTEQSLNVGMPAYPNLHREAPNFNECSPIQSHELDDSHTVASSVGSCSVSSGVDNASYCLETAALSSDADSCSRGKNDRIFNSFPDEMLEAERYRFELHEYRKLLEAFQLSGFISWEKEGLLTDLRMSLHISDDDHLTELKQLRSRSTVLHCK